MAVLFSMFLRACESLCGKYVFRFLKMGGKYFKDLYKFTNLKRIFLAYFQTKKSVIMAFI